MTLNESKATSGDVLCKHLFAVSRSWLSGVMLASAPGTDTAGVTGVVSLEQSGVRDRPHEGTNGAGLSGGVSEGVRVPAEATEGETDLGGVL